MRYHSAIELAFALGRSIEADAAKELLVRVLEKHPDIVLDIANGADSALVKEVKEIYGREGSTHTSSYAGAIKHYREVTGASLKEAKDAVDKIIRRG